MARANQASISSRLIWFSYLFAIGILIASSHLFLHHILCISWKWCLYISIISINFIQIKIRCLLFIIQMNRDDILYSHRLIEFLLCYVAIILFQEWTKKRTKTKNWRKTNWKKRRIFWIYHVLQLVRRWWYTYVDQSM